MGFSIKEIAALSGVKAHTIRIWEQRYHFLKPSRTTTNIRQYSNEELKTLLTVALLNKYGYKISKIDEMPPERRAQEVLSLPFEEAREDYLIQQLTSFMIDMNGQEFERTLQKNVYQQGLQKTLTSVVFQFLERTGILWQTGRIHPAQEHIVANIIRQKIIAGIDLLPTPQVQKPLMLLFLPENQYHELGLLFVYFLLRQKRLPVLYLGANVPLKDIHYVLQQKKTSSLYIHLSAASVQPNFQKYLSSLFAQNPGIRILLSGHAAQGIRKKKGQQLEVLQTLSAVSSYISSL